MSDSMTANEELKIQPLSTGARLMSTLWHGVAPSLCGNAVECRGHSFTPSTLGEARYLRRGAYRPQAHLGRRATHVLIFGGFTVQSLVKLSPLIAYHSCGAARTARSTAQESDRVPLWPKRRRMNRKWQDVGGIFPAIFMLGNEVCIFDKDVSRHRAIGVLFWDGC